MNANAQKTSTLCQTVDVPVASATTDLRLIGCGEGFPDNVLWHLDRADSLNGALDESMNRPATGKGAVVYLCDTGVMRDHDEFARPDGSAVIGAVHGNGIDSVCPGHDPALEPCYYNDATLNIYTHGTATASIVAGRTTGVAPGAKIVSVYMQNIGSRIDLWLKTFDEIIRHAWDPRTPQFRTGIISMSFVPNYASMNDRAFPQFEKKMREMIAGVDRDGNPDPNGKRFLFVTIAGNHITSFGDHCDAAMNSNLFPSILGSSIEGLITVGGIDETNHIWERSCRGPAVDVLAPAMNMLVASITARDHYRSGHPYNGYPPNEGTSYAAPYVAGLAALLLEENPAFTPEELERIIKSTASRVANRDEPTAAGRVAIIDLLSKMPRRRSVKR